MTPRFITQRLPIVGLVGIVATYWFLADAIPELAAFSKMAVISENPLMVRGFYLILSFLIAILTMLFPAKLAFIVPSIFFFGFFLAILIAGTVAVFTIAFWLLALMIGFDLKLSSLAIDWVLISGGFVAPVMFLNAIAALLVSITQKGLKQHDLLKQLEIIILLTGASWLGLALGWGL